MEMNPVEFPVAEIDIMNDPRDLRQRMQHIDGLPDREGADALASAGPTSALYPS